MYLESDASMCGVGGLLSPLICRYIALFWVGYRVLCVILSATYIRLGLSLFAE